MLGCVAYFGCRQSKKIKMKKNLCKYCGTELILIRNSRKNVFLCDYCPAIFDAKKQKK